MGLATDLHTTERLILAAGGDERGLAALTRELGLAAIAPILVDEIAFRANAAAGGDPLRMDAEDTEYGSVALGVHDRGAQAEFLLTVHSGGRVSYSQDTRDDVAMRLDYELHELMRVLFGPGQARPAGTHGAQFLPPIAGQDDERPSPDRVYRGLYANGVVMSGLSQHTPDLSQLARRYMTHKGGGVHWFTGLYERHLRELRDQPVRILEVGVGGYGHPTYGGESLRMWKRWFHRGLVFGIDLFDKSAVDEQRLTTLVADQSDLDALVAIDEAHGPFDIVIDDGSHINEHVLATFAALFPRLRSGGIYVVEELWTAYAPGYGGQAAAAPDSTTSIGLLRDIVDGLQYEEQPHDADYAPSYRERHAVGLHVYHNIAFVEKGINAEGAVPSWVPRSPVH